MKRRSRPPSADTHPEDGGLLDVYRQRWFALGMIVALFLSALGALALSRAPSAPEVGFSSPTPSPLEARVAVLTNTPLAVSTVFRQGEAVATPWSTETASPTRVQEATPTTVRKPTRAPKLAGTSTPRPSSPSVGERSGRSAPDSGTPTPLATRLAGSRSVPPSPRYEPLPPRTDGSLENQIREYLDQEVDSYGVVVKRLSDGDGVVINADRQFYAASLFKILVMFEVFKQRELNLLTFDESLTFTPPYIDYELGPLRWPVWSQVSVRDLLEAMITESDNVAAMMLHDRTGGWNIIADFKSIGLKHTDIANDSMPTSAGDMSLWLEMMARGKAVNEKSSQEMIDLLARQKVNDRLPALLPAGIKLAHKTGNWDNVTHDVGVVYAPHGAYVIAVLSDKAWESQPIAEISKLVYEYFEGIRGTPRGGIH